jgi:hypothetical protein
MNNKILFKNAYKTFDEMRRNRYHLCDDPEAWSEDDVITLVYDVALTTRDTVMEQIPEKLKLLLTDEQLRQVLDAISEPPTAEPQEEIKVPKRRIRDLNISTRAMNCLYMNDVFTTDDLLYGNFLPKRFRMARGVGKKTLKEVEDLIARLKNEEKNDN